MTVASGNGSATKLTAFLVEGVIISASAGGQTSSLQCEVRTEFFFSSMTGTMNHAFFHRQNCEVTFLDKHSVMSVRIYVRK